MRETNERARERTGLICIGTFYTEMAACGFLNTLGRAGPKEQAQARRCLIRYEFGYYKVYDPGP